MATTPQPFNRARRHLLKLLGLGTMALIGSSLVSEKLFARQFVEDVPTKSALPPMVYDRDLQMMVDPQTRLPIYEDASKMQVASGLPTVTAGCSDCPKRDDWGD